MLQEGELAVDGACLGRLAALDLVLLDLYRGELGQLPVKRAEQPFHLPPVPRIGARHFGALGKRQVFPDSVGSVAAVNLQRYGSEFHQRNVLGISGLQASYARLHLHAFLN